MSTDAPRKIHSSPSLDTIVLIGLSLFFVLVLSDGIRVFQQFSWFQVVGVGVAFLVLVAFLFALFNFRKLRQIQLGFTVSAVLWGVGLGLFLFALSLTALGNWAAYFPAAPLLQLDAGRGLHQDSVFHVSLIQSILNLGYPSTGQHGLPFMPYHVLSHYVDAGILAVTGLEPLDSYGLLFHFKSFAFLALSTTFLWVVFREKARWGFALALILFTPLLAGDWLVIGSEGLWFTSLLVIASAPLVARIVTSDIFRTSHMLILMTLGICIGVGKVSSGLVFALLIGFYVLLRFPRNFRVYIMGVVWVGFFGIFSAAQDSGSGSGTKFPHLSGITGFLNPWTTYPGGPVEWNLVGIYLILLVLFSAWLRSKNRPLLFLVFSSVFTLLCLSVLMMVPAPGGLSQPDIAYFVLALYFALLLFGLLALLNGLSYPISAPGKLTGKIWLSLMGVFTAALVMTMTKPVILHPTFELPAVPVQSGAGQLRSQLTSFMQEYNVTPRNSVLVIPTEVFKDELAQWGGPFWAQGLTVYALTGVPLHHGLTDLSQQDFGQGGYSDALSLSRAEIEERGFEELDSGTHVIVVESVLPPRFEILK